MRSNASNKQFGENMRLGLASYTEPKLGGGGVIAVRVSESTGLQRWTAKTAT